MLINRATDFLVYTRGANEEYDRWAEMTGDSGWSWAELAPYYFKVGPINGASASHPQDFDYNQSSRLVPPVDHHDTRGQVNPAEHGTGPVEVSLPGFPTEIDNLVISTAKAPESNFPFNLDVSSGKPLGVGE